MTDLTERLAEALEVCQGATEGPWEAEYSRDQGNCVIPHDAKSTLEAVAITRLYDQQFDAEFIAHARTGYPAALRALQAVLELHAPEKRWQPDIEAEVSYDTFGEAEDACDGSESGITYFEVCAECKRVEESHDNTHTIDGGYLTSLWPCPTVRAITEHLDSTP